MTSEEYNFECKGLTRKAYKDKCMSSAFATREGEVAQPVFSYLVGNGDRLHAMIDYLMNNWLDYRILMTVNKRGVSFLLHIRPVNDIPYQEAQQKALDFSRQFKLGGCGVLDGDATILDEDGDVTAWMSFDDWND